MLETFTIVHYESSVQALKPPYAIGVIKLDGADTAMTHFIGGCRCQGYKSRE